MKYILIASIVLFATTSILYKTFYPAYEWHQKMTVYVQTPNGIVSGSSVVQQRVSFEPALLPDANEVRTSFTGEAVQVTIPADNQYLFALHPSNRAWTMLMSYHDVGAEEINLRRAYQAIEQSKEVVELRREFYPKFVTFRDPSDPLSVELISPEEMTSRFGEEFSISRITLEVTNEELTVGLIEQSLPWLAFIFPRQLDGERLVIPQPEYPEANSISSLQFITETHSNDSR